MDLGLKGKVAIVTGTNRKGAIGDSIARILGGNCAIVLRSCGRRTARLKRTLLAWFNAQT